ncbi:hypothetical protein OB955_18525 [Halobacteria archaeon AArc-m2/3/4]|uniref:Uncharacterized protein n=1 Tax=Natronoglomus mannanivorans TaxID=2979990 RepID=A0ABT2QIF1_9EURY|nr:hypothetical protein [Halobacteria archaeon AArc-m2/3/4]
MVSELPQSLAEEWHAVGTDTDEMEFGVATVTAETTLYERESTRVERADLRLGPGPDRDFESDDGTDGERDDSGGGDIPIRSLFVIDLTSSPSLSSVGLAPEAVLGTAAEKATDLFVGRLEDDGVVVADGNDRAASEFDRGDGTVGRWYTLSVSYPVLTAERKRELEDSAGTETDSETDELDDHNPRIDAETHLAIWPTDDAYRMAGGTVPLRISDDAPAEIVDALEIDAGRDREAILELVRTVGLESAAERDGGRAESDSSGETETEDSPDEDTRSTPATDESDGDV